MRGYPFLLLEHLSSIHSFIHLLLVHSCLARRRLVYVVSGVCVFIPCVQIVIMNERSCWNMFYYARSRQILLFNRHHNYPHLTRYITPVLNPIMVIWRPHTWWHFRFLYRMQFFVSIKTLPRSAEIFYFCPDQLLWYLHIQMVVDPNLGDILTCLRVSFVSRIVCLISDCWAN